MMHVKRAFGFFRRFAAILADFISFTGFSLCFLPWRAIVRFIAAPPLRAVFTGVSAAFWVVSSNTFEGAALSSGLLVRFDLKILATFGAENYQWWAISFQVTPIYFALCRMGVPSNIYRLPFTKAFPRAKAASCSFGCCGKGNGALLTDSGKAWGRVFRNILYIIYESKIAALMILEIQTFFRIRGNL